MKNSSWGIESFTENDVHVVLLVSRAKDNKHIENFKERRTSFITDKTVEDLHEKFTDFASHGSIGETSRMYYSINARNMEKVYKNFLHFLIDNNDFNLCSVQGKLAGIAAQHENAATKKWMFDFDEQNDELLEEFCKDLEATDKTLCPEVHKTPNGHAVIISHGFDMKDFWTKWAKYDITVKKDDLLCVAWTTKNAD